MLAVATIAIGIIGFSFWSQITHLLGGYLAHYFGIGKESASPEIHILPEGGKTFFGLNPIGRQEIIWILCNRRYSAMYIYIAERQIQRLSQKIVTRAIWKFLYNRWYLNTALYRDIVIGPLAIYRILEIF